MLKIENLGLPTMLSNTLRRAKITDLSILLDDAIWRDPSLSSSERLLAACQEASDNHPRYQTDGSFKIGPAKWQLLFDALLPLAASNQAKPRATNAGLNDREAMACQLVAAMISGTTGSIGGRDQAANFAEIAFDMLDAIHAEKLKREA